MINAHELTTEVNFNEGFDPDSLIWNEHLDSLQVTEADVAAGSLRLVGFGMPFSRTGYNHGAVVTPLTEFADLPADHKGIDEQGKGVGPRMYNVREAFGGARTKPADIGVFTFDIDPQNILDLRASQGSKVHRIARHAGRILRAKLNSTEAVVAGIHASYGDADAVHLEMPPLPELRQVQHGVRNPAGVTPQFMIIRKPNILLHRVGSTSAPW